MDVRALRRWVAGCLVLAGLGVACTGAEPAPAAPAKPETGKAEAVQAAPAPTAPAQVEPAKAQPTGPEKYEKNIVAMEEAAQRQPPPADVILFAGSSTFTGWKTLKDDFAPLPVLNRGFGGSTYRDLLHYLDRVVIALKPPVVVIYEGDNDLAGAKALAEQTVANAKELVRRIHEALPETTIVFTAIKPTQSRWARWPEMKKANDAIREFTTGLPKLAFVDTASIMLGPDGQPVPELYQADRLHMTRAGQQRWIAVLKPVLERLHAPPAAAAP